MSSHSHHSSHPQFSRALSASPQTLTYAQAGVSVDAGDALVQAIKPFTRSTRRPGADGEIGGFGGLFDLKACGYEDPLLVSGTDGVGTKLKVAAEVGTRSSRSVNSSSPDLFTDFSRY